MVFILGCSCESLRAWRKYGCPNPVLKDSYFDSLGENPRQQDIQKLPKWLSWPAKVENNCISPTCSLKLFSELPSCLLNQIQNTLLCLIWTWVLHLFGSIPHTILKLSPGSSTILCLTLPISISISSHAMKTSLFFLTAVCKLIISKLNKVRDYAIIQS